MMDQDSINIPKVIAQFTKWYIKIDNYQKLYVVTGPEKSGKSVFADLLCGKTLVEYEDQEIQSKIIVQENNCSHQYETIYIQETKKQSSLIIESFELSDEQKVQTLKNKYNFMKSLFFREYLRSIKNLCLIVLIEEGQKQKINQYLQHLLECIGITSNQEDQNINLIKSCIYLVISKIQDEESDYYQLIKDLSNVTDNQNVRIILQHIDSEKKVQKFLSSEPKPNYYQQIKQKFKNIQISNQKLKAFSKSYFDDQKQAFGKDIQVQIMEMFYKIVSMIRVLIQYSNGDKQKLKEYETKASQLYPNDLNKNDVNRMATQIDISKLNLPQAIQSAIKIFNYASYSQLASVFIQILQRYQQTCKKNIKDDFKEIQVNIIFCQYFGNWIGQRILEKHAQILIKQFSIIQKLTNQTVINQSDKQKQNKMQPTKSSKTKKPAAFQTFQTSIREKCKNNKQALQYCLKTVADKQNEPNYDTLDVIYYLRLIGDILYQFKSQPFDDYLVFADELLELYLYKEDYYHFWMVLKEVLRRKLLKKNKINCLIQILSNAKKYQFCTAVINYALENIIDDENYEKMRKVKRKIQKQKEKQFMMRDISQKQAPTALNQPKKQLKISITLIQKISFNKNYDKYFNGNNFQKRLPQKQQT